MNSQMPCAPGGQPLHKGSACRPPKGATARPTARSSTGRAEPAGYFFFPGPALGRSRRLARSQAGNHVPAKEAMRKDNFSEGPLFAVRIKEHSDSDTRVHRDEAVRVVLHEVKNMLLGSAAVVSHAANKVAQGGCFPRIERLLQGKFANIDLLRLRVPMHVESKGKVPVGTR